MSNHLILGITGASGIYAADILMDKSPWPVEIISSKWADKIYLHERGNMDELLGKSCKVHANDDLASPLSSGSVPTCGMVILPCSVNTLGKIASGICDNLITRSAHCHLKEKRPLLLCLREAPLTTIDLENASKIAIAGGIIIPLAPPFFMFGDRSPKTVTMHDLLASFIDRVLMILGHPAPETWEDKR